MKADKEGMQRYGIEEGTVIGARLAECGFDVFERDDGLHPDSDYVPNPRYNDYLKSKDMTTLIHGIRAPMVSSPRIILRPDTVGSSNTQTVRPMWPKKTVKHLT
jgi:hypothetical protein